MTQMICIADLTLEINVNVKNMALYAIFNVNEDI